MKIKFSSITFIVLFSLSHSTWAGPPRCDSDNCIIACINNFDSISDTSTPAKLAGNQCEPDVGGMSLDQVCKSKGFKGVAAHDRNFKDRPPVWCPDVVTY